MPDLFDFSSFPVLQTSRLTLRRMTLDDADSMMRLFGDARVLTYLNQAPMDTREKALEFIDWLRGNYERHEAIDWTITTHDGDFVGMCGLYQWNRNDRRIDLGYHILPDVWGRGYATEATHAMLGWGFAALDLHRVQADCTDGHGASERVLLKCGFTLEGIWRESCFEHGRFVNIRQFGLLRREYNQPD